MYYKDPKYPDKIFKGFLNDPDGLLCLKIEI